MTYTNTQFKQFLRGGASNFSLIRLVELKFAVQVASAPAEYTLYLSDKEYTTGPNDIPPNTKYHAVLMPGSIIAAERGLSLETLRGQITVSIGQLRLNNADGRIGDILIDLIADAREAKTFVGGEGWARADFVQVDAPLVGPMKAVNDNEFVVELRSKNFLLDASIVGAPLTGPAADIPCPIMVGQTFNVDLTPYLIDAAGPTYAFTDDPATTNVGPSPYDCVLDVRDGGVSLIAAEFSGTNAAITTTAGNTINFTAHGLLNDSVVWVFGDVFSGLTIKTQYWVVNKTANTFQVSLTRGGAAITGLGTTFSGTAVWSSRRWFVNFSATPVTITLSAAAQGRVTADFNVSGALYPTYTLASPHVALNYFLDKVGFPTADRDTAAIDAMIARSIIDTAHGYTWGIAILKRVNVLNELLNNIAACTNSWYGWTTNGKLTVGQLDLANLDTATAVDSIDAATDIQTDLSCENLPIQFGRSQLDFKRNSCAQTDFLTSVTPAQRLQWGNTHQLHIAYQVAVDSTYLNAHWLYHKSALDSEPVNTLFAATSRMLNFFAPEYRALYKPWTRIYRCTVGIDKYGLNPGDCVTLTYPRYGLSAGKNVRVMSVKPDWFAGTVDLVLARQVTPNYTTTSYN